MSGTPIPLWLAEGLRAYRGGAYFEAHEAWEERWRAAEDPEERLLLQALVQLAAAGHKVSTGIRPGGAPALFERAARKLEGLGAPRWGLDLPGVARAARACATAARAALAEGRPPTGPPPPL